MPDTNIFNSATPDPVVPPVISTPTSNIPPELSELVGEGKKYATPEAALASIPHAQRHILTLEQENASIKADLEKRKTTEQLLEEIKASTTPQTPTNVPAGLDTATIAKLIEQTINQKETQKSNQENISTVTSTFKNKYGEKAEEFYINLAQESGMSVQYLNALAATSPKAVLKLAGLTQSLPPVSRTSGTINTDVMKPTEGEPETARVKQGASTKELVRAWRAAGVTVGKPV